VYNFENRAYIGMLENRMMGRMFVRRREDATVGWEKLQNKELHKLLSSPDIIRTI
jgi:hypothetical protein